MQRFNSKSGFAKSLVESDQRFTHKTTCFMFDRRDRATCERDDVVYQHERARTRLLSVIWVDAK